MARIGRDVRISIHAAREGGDKTEKHDYREMRISIHAAREGGDDIAKWQQKLKRLFQSTPPVKAATVFLSFSRKRGLNFYPRRP